MKSPGEIALLFFILFLGVAGFLYYPRAWNERAAAERLATLLAGADGAAALGPRVKSVGCVLREASPDPDCTPGAVFTDATPEKICVSGYSKTVRNVSDKIRKAVFAAYGISYPQPRGAYEVDHLIPLAIGGSNDIANLFPQPAIPEAAETNEVVLGFREKDVVEVYLRDEVCSGRASLAAAQEQIAKDWLLIYNDLSPAKIAEIKKTYSNWSN
ncbi:MAG: HNH endonuclease signature motif containing protein [Patescibacteria group bacterium]